MVTATVEHPAGGTEEVERDALIEARQFVTRSEERRVGKECGADGAGA